jgi:putative DNA primase/helicase
MKAAPPSAPAVTEERGAFMQACPPDYRKSIETESDAGNSRRFVIDHGADVRYVAAWRRWFLWDGFHFRADDTNQVVLRAMTTARAIFDEAKHVGEEDRQRRRAKHAIISQHQRAIRAMLDLASAQPEIAARPEDFDADPNLLGVANGVVDLRTGELLNDGARRLITKRVCVPFERDAVCPMFQTFIESILVNREDLQAFLRVAIGYTLTGLTNEHVILLVIGGGSNGKTTLLELLFDLMGDYAARASSDSLLLARSESSEIPNDVARLVGKRFVVCTELEAGRRLREARVKELTGSDTVTARFMRGEWFDFRPQFKVWLVGNHLPRIHGTDHGIWRRVRLLEFGVTIRDDDQDRALPEKLRGELPGILSWAIRGAQEWYRSGVQTSAQIKDAGEHYRDSEDIIGQFLAERCTCQPNAREPLKDIATAYNAWADANSERRLSSRALGTWFEERGYRKERATGNAVFVKGVRLHG